MRTSVFRVQMRDPGSDVWADSVDFPTFYTSAEAMDAMDILREMVPTLLFRVVQLNPIVWLSLDIAATVRA